MNLHDLSLYKEVLDLKRPRPLEEFGNGTITGHFGLVFEENSVREITGLSRRHRFRQAPFSALSKCFSCTRERKAGFFKFVRF